jgi:fatty acid synthase subunit beta
MTTITLRKNRLAIAISADVSDATFANTLRDEFESNLESEVESSIHLCALFIEYLKLKNSGCERSCLEILRGTLVAMHNLTQSQHIEMIVAESNFRTSILSSYYSSMVLLGVNFSRPSALLRAAGGNAIFGIFGGQGPNKEYMNELQLLYDVYGSIIHELLVSAENALDLPILRWLMKKDHPNLSYTASVPISLPLIGVTQLCQYYVYCWVSGMSLSSMLQSLKGSSTR